MDISVEVDGGRNVMARIDAIETEAEVIKIKDKWSQKSARLKHVHSIITLETNVSVDEDGPKAKITIALYHCDEEAT